MNKSTPKTVTRVVRLCVDTGALTDEQTALLARSAGTARAVYNWGLALRNEQKDQLDEHVRRQAAALVGEGKAAIDAQIKDDPWRTAAYKAAPDALRKSLSAFTLGKVFTAETRDPESTFAWWQTEKHGVSRFVVSSALQALDHAFDRYYRMPPVPEEERKKRKPRKDGRPHGWPRFHSKHDGRDGFALFNLVTTGQDPWRVVQDGHRLRLPSLGSVRVHENTKRLRRMIQRGGVPKSARFTRHAGRWYVSVNVSLPVEALPAPSLDAAQRAGGIVGVDLGVKYLATLSDGSVVHNARHGQASSAKVKRLQRKMARRVGPKEGRKPSKRWGVLRVRSARAQHMAALRRQGAMHELTKRLATGYAVVGVESLNVRGMTGAPASRPDPDRPGAFLPNGAAAKSGLNRAILDVGFGEFVRQLQYKTSWYGSDLVQVARFAPTSKTCSGCGAVKAKLSLSERTYTCAVCGLVIDRDLNAAQNIRALAAVAVGAGSSPADVGDVKRPDRAVSPGAPGVAVVEVREDPAAVVGSQGRATDPSPPSDTGHAA